MTYVLVYIFATNTHNNSLKYFPQMSNMETGDWLGYVICQTFLYGNGG